MKQQFTKEIQNSEGETTHIAKVQNRNLTVFGEDIKSYSIALTETLTDENDWQNNSYIHAMGNNEQGDIKIKAVQEMQVRDAEEEINYRIVADMVITREDAKSLIKQLTHLL